MKAIIDIIEKMLVLLIVIGGITARLDYLNMIDGKVPIFNIDTYDSEKRIQTYRGIFYTATRKVRVSTREDLTDSTNITYSLFIISYDVENRIKEKQLPLSIETTETNECTGISNLYYANTEYKLYTYCLDEVNLNKDSKKDTLLNYLKKDSTIIEDIDSSLGFGGVFDNNKTLYFQSYDDNFTNNGLAMFKCNNNDYYIGPKNMSFQPDFCTFKDDELRFIFEIEENIPEGTEVVKEAETFYEDENYRYEFSEKKSDYVYIVVPAVRGRVENRISLKDAINSGIFTIDDLNEKGLVFNKVDKNAPPPAEQ